MQAKKKYKRHKSKDELYPNKQINLYTQKIWTQLVHKYKSTHNDYNIYIRLTIFESYAQTKNS